MTSKFTKHVVCGESSVTLSYETSTEDFDQALDEWVKFKKAESYAKLDDDCDTPTMVDREKANQ